MTNLTRLLPILILGCGTLAAEPPGLAPETIVEQYTSASLERRNSLNGASMEVEIRATMPKLKKTGRLQALRHISRLGRITYDALRFEGDGAIKNNVIARYLTAESEAQGDELESLAVTPANYKFKYKGLTSLEGHEAHLFQVTPRKKRLGLYKGEIWIDTQTFLRVRESGYFVRNPSIFLRKVQFVRDYEIREGVSVPRRIQSVVETRLVGKAELTIDFRNVSLAPAGEPNALSAEGQ